MVIVFVGDLMMILVSFELFLFIEGDEMIMCLIVGIV